MNNYGLLIRNKHPASRQARLCRRDQARSGWARLQISIWRLKCLMMPHCPTVSLSHCRSQPRPENFNLPIIGPNFDYLIRENARSLSRNLESKLNCDNFQTVTLSSSFSAIDITRERELGEALGECFLGTVNMSCYIFYWTQCAGGLLNTNQLYCSQ